MSAMDLQSMLSLSPSSLLMFVVVWVLFKWYYMWLMFTDRKDGDPSLAGDQTDGKLKDSKERWVLFDSKYRVKQTVQYLFSLCLNLENIRLFYIYSFILFQLFRLISYIQLFESMQRLLFPIKRSSCWLSGAFMHMQTLILRHTQHVWYIGIFL